MNNEPFSPSINPPAIIGSVAPIEHYRVVAEIETYRDQWEANIGSVASNLEGASRVIKEVARNPALLGSEQAMTELDARLDFLERNEPVATAGLRAALASIGPRPEQLPDPELVWMLDFIKTKVAPLREDECLTEVELPPAKTALERIGHLMGLDTSDPADETSAELPDWVATAIAEGASVAV